MSTIFLTVEDLTKIADSLAAKGYSDQSIGFKLIDTGQEIVVRDVHDGFITNWKKPVQPNPHRSGMNGSPM
jgi:hypothetical protein